MPEPSVETIGPRRRPAVSLRVLMVVVLVVGGVLGWWVRRASLQGRGVAAVRAAGGSVWYDYQKQGTRYTLAARPWAPDWLRKAVGDEYLMEPTTVFLQGSLPKADPPPSVAETVEGVALLDSVEEINSLRFPIDDAGFARLATMPRLDSVHLLDAAITDAGLARVADFPALDTLRIRVKGGLPGISVKGLEQIARLPRIKFLAIINTRLDGPSDLAPLAKLTRLEYLRLQKSPADDACLAHLRGLTSMERLDLSSTRLTDPGVDHLEGMARLKRLMIDGSLLTDAGVAKLSGHPTLEEIYLTPSATRITDASLATFGRLRGITVLLLEGADVTDAGLAKLLASHQFRDLMIPGTGVTSAGLASIAGQARLRTLSLDRTKVDDAGANVLAPIPALEILRLSRTPITDAGLASLQLAPRLTLLDVRGTNVTGKGLDAFRKARPNVTVLSGPADPDPWN